MARHRDTSYLKNWNCAGFAHGGNHRIASETKQAKLDYSMGGLGGPRAMSDLGGTFQVSGFRFQVSGFRFLVSGSRRNACGYCRSIDRAWRRLTRSFRTARLKAHPDTSKSNNQISTRDLRRLVGPDLKT